MLLSALLARLVSILVILGPAAIMSLPTKTANPPLTSQQAQNISSGSEGTELKTRIKKLHIRMNCDCRGSLPQNGTTTTTTSTTTIKPNQTTPAAPIAHTCDCCCIPYCPCECHPAVPCKTTTTTTTTTTRTTPTIPTTKETTPSPTTEPPEPTTTEPAPTKKSCCTVCCHVCPCEYGYPPSDCPCHPAPPPEVPYAPYGGGVGPNGEMILPPGVSNSEQGQPQWPQGPPGTDLGMGGVAVNGGFLANPLNEEPMLDDNSLVNGDGYNHPQNYQPAYSKASGCVGSGLVVAVVALFSALLSLAVAFTSI